MKKKVKMADVLWDAANQRLDPHGDWVPCEPHEHYSCCAVARVISNGRTDCQPPKVDKWLTSLGCDTGSDGFANFQDRRQRQGIRYMWLLLAMHVAEDEGIEIEVQS